MAQCLPNSTRGGGTTPQLRPPSRLFGQSSGTGHLPKTVDIDSADHLLTQTQRNLERVMREKHELERTVMRLESRITELERELESAPHGKTHIQHHHIAQEDSVDESVSAALGRAGQLLVSLYEEAPSPDSPLDILRFLTDRLHELHTAEQRIQTLEKEREGMKAEFTQLAKEWAQAEQQFAREIQSLHHELDAQQTRAQNAERAAAAAQAQAARPQNRVQAESEPIQGRSEAAPVSKPAMPAPLQRVPSAPQLVGEAREASPKSDANSPTASLAEKSLSEQLRMQEVVDGVRESVQLLRQHLRSDQPPDLREAFGSTGSEFLEAASFRRPFEDEKDDEEGDPAWEEFTEAFNEEAEQSHKLFREVRQSHEHLEHDRILLRALQQKDAQRDAERRKAQAAAKSHAERVEEFETLHRQCEDLKKQLRAMEALREHDQETVRSLRDHLEAGRQSLQSEVDHFRQCAEMLTEIFQEPFDEDLVERIRHLAEVASLSGSPGSSPHTPPAVDTPTSSSSAALSPLDLVLKETTLHTPIPHHLPPRIPLPGLSEWGFDTLQHTKDIAGGPLYQIGCNVAHELGFFADGLVEEATWQRFLLGLQSNYRDVPYHCATHAADVVQSLYALLKLTGLLDKVPPVERMAVIAAAAGHDVEHPGRNNGFLINSRHPLATRYNDMAVLEAHHAATTSGLLQRPEFDITARLSPADAARFRTVLTQSILGTDMSVHARHVVEFEQRCRSGKPFDAAAPEDRIVLLSTLLHAADISNPMKAPTIAEKWAERVTAEFHDQGREEMRRGLKISFGCDPSVTNIAPSQIGFLRMVIIPFVYCLTECFKETLRPLITNCIAGWEFWATRAGGAVGPPPEPKPVAPAQPPPSPVAAPVAVPAAPTPAEAASPSLLASLQRRLKASEQLVIEYQQLCAQLTGDGAALAEKAAFYASCCAPADSLATPPQKRMLIISGPSGAGKSTVVAYLMEEFGDQCVASVSHTTRAPRKGEVDGVHYHFVSQAKFDEMKRNGAFLEHAIVHGRSYGTSKQALREALETGQLVILSIDVNGAKYLREQFAETGNYAMFFLFLTPPSIDTLQERLQNRGKDSPEEIAVRMQTARKELEFVVQNDSLFDQQVENAAIDETTARVRRLLLSRGLLQFRP